MQNRETAMEPPADGQYPNAPSDAEKSSGITPDCRTMVVVPTLLSSNAGIEHLLEGIEVHYLSNRDRNLYFALLTDFEDADQQRMPSRQERSTR